MASLMKPLGKAAEFMSGEGAQHALGMPGGKKVGKAAGYLTGSNLAEKYLEASAKLAGGTPSAGEAPNLVSMPDAESTAKAGKRGFARRAGGRRGGREETIMSALGGKLGG